MGEPGPRGELVSKQALSRREIKGRLIDFYLYNYYKSN